MGVGGAETLELMGLLHIQMTMGILLLTGSAVANAN